MVLPRKEDKMNNFVATAVVWAGLVLWAICATAYHHGFAKGLKGGAL